MKDFRPNVFQDLTHVYVQRKRDPFYFAIFILLGTLLPGPVGLARPAEGISTATPAVVKYEELLTAIRQAKAESRKRVETLVQQEKVREVWKIGTLIDAHVLQHKQRANYDEQVIDRLAKDLESSPTEIRLMLRFARAYPIQPPAFELSWAHYRELLSLEEPKEREEIARLAVKEHWGRDRVRAEVRRRKAMKKPAERKEPAREILWATPGQSGTYRVVKAYYGDEPNQLVLDLGFSNYLSLEADASRRWPQEPSGAERRGATAFKVGDIVQEKKGKLKKLKGLGEKDLFTYSASVIRVIDGDTFSAAVELGFGFTTVQTLRFRALDVPEIESAEGREAKEFLEKLMPRRLAILIRAHRSDKYDRYLADVFVDGDYLNQKLVDEGFAVPISE